MAGTALLGHALPAGAQENGDATVLGKIEVSAESDEILVQDGYVAKKDRIGTKLDTPIAKIPQAVSVVTQKQIEDQKPRTLNESLGYTASANPNSFGFDTRYDAFFLRGFQAFYNGMFRDGLRQYNGPSAWFKTEPFGIEGVTILKARHPRSTASVARAASSTSSPSAPRTNRSTRSNCWPASITASRPASTLPVRSTPTAASSTASPASAA
ncbi:hypothetical protein AJ88_48940 [Mesorhizobium amorphae CCBAU 01583]|nr:hypothetical protein AJ88_48940 [Mesorhizobium amorphae CCBAU 01583]